MERNEWVTLVYFSKHQPQRGVYVLTGDMQGSVAISGLILQGRGKE